MRVERERGVRLEREPKGEVEWVDAEGKTYDAVGNFDSRYFDKQWPRLQARILDHLDKAECVPVDVSRSSTAQVQKVQQFVQGLGPRVFIVGK